MQWPLPSPLRLGNRVFVKWLHALTASSDRARSGWQKRRGKAHPRGRGNPPSWLRRSLFNSIRPACFAKPKTHFLLWVPVDRSGTDPAVARASCELRNHIGRSGWSSWKSEDGHGAPSSSDPADDDRTPLTCTTPLYLTYSRRRQSFFTCISS